MGEYETLNFSIGLPTEDIAIIHALYRTSIKGRHDFIDMMFHDDNDEGAVMSIEKSYVSRTAEIFNVILKQLGMAVDFYSADDMIKSYDNSAMCQHSIDGKTYICTDYQFWLIQKIYDIREEVLEMYPIITSTKLNQIILEVLDKGGKYDGSILEDLKATVLAESENRVGEIADELCEEANKELTEEPEVVEEKPKKRTRKKKSE